MLIMIPVFKSKEKAKVTWILFGSIMLAFLLTASIFWGIQFNKQKTHPIVNAMVTDYSVSDGRNVWTEFSYVYDNQEFVVRVKGHSYWMGLGKEIEVLCNPSDPKQIETLSGLYTWTSVFLIISVLFAVVFLFYLGNYCYILIKDKKHNGS